MSINTSVDNNYFKGVLGQLAQTAVDNNTYYGVYGGQTNGQMSWEGGSSSINPNVKVLEAENTITSAPTLVFPQPINFSQSLGSYLLFNNTNRSIGGNHQYFSLVKGFYFDDNERTEDIPADAFFNLGNGTYALSLAKLTSHNQDNISVNDKHKNPYQNINWVITQNIHDQFISPNPDGNRTLVVATDNQLSKPISSIKYFRFVNMCNSSIQFSYRIKNNSTITSNAVKRGSLSSIKPIVISGNLQGYSGTKATLQIDGTKVFSDLENAFMFI